MARELFVRAARNAARMSIPCAGFLASMLIASLPLRANVFWQLPAGQMGDWSVATNWGGTVPNGFLAGEITNGGTATITSAVLSCYQAYVTNGGILMTGGSLNFTGVLYLTASNSTTTFTQTGGVLSMPSSAAGVNVDTLANGTSTYNLSNSGYVTGPELSLGFSGTGTCNQSGGTDAMTGIIMGNESGGLGTYNLMGAGYITTNLITVGNTGHASGNFVQSGGTTVVFNQPTIAGFLYLAAAPNGSGSYSLTSGLLSAPQEFVGEVGSGAFTQSGGTNNIPAESIFTTQLMLGEVGGSTGSYVLSQSGVLTASGHEIIGGSGTGNFTQSGGINTLTGTNGTSQLILAQSTSSSTGTYTLSGTGQLTAPSESIGQSGSGVFTQSGGSNTVNGSLYVGYSGTGAYNLKPNGWLAAQNEYIGFSGPGTFTQSGGTNIVTGAFSLNFAFGSSAGTYSLNGGLLSVAKISMGTGASAVMNLNGGTLSANAPFSTTVPMSLGTSGGGATIDTAGFAVTLAASLSGPGSLTKVDSGALTLTATNTYNGPTTIDQGELIVNGSLADSAVTVNGGTLGGTGTLNNVTVNSGGEVAPGDAPGVMHLSGSLTMAAGAAMDFELDSPTSYDQLELSGPAVLGGELNVSLVNGFSPAVGQSFDLINGHTNGSFAEINLPTLGSDLRWDTGQLYTNGTIEVLPEPSTLLLLAVGAIGLIGCGWRKHRGFARSASVPVLALLILLGTRQTISAADPVNLALNKPASSSSIENDEHSAAQANDGDPETCWCADDEPEGGPEWWQVDLQKPFEVSGCGIRWPYDGKQYRYKVEGSADGKNWSLLSDQAKSTATSQVHDLKFQKARQVRYLKITVTGFDEGCWASISEVQVFGLKPTPGSP